MYHWDLPYALQCKGGFGNRKIVDWFLEYARVLLDHFGADVPIRATFNEPIAIYVGYYMGIFAPGLHDEEYARQSLHNLLVCHGKAVQKFRTYGFPDSKIGIVVDVWHHYPARPDNADDIAMAIHSNEIEGYGMFLNPLFLGGWTGEMQAYLKEKQFQIDVLPGDFDIIREPIDYYGLNFCNGLFDNAKEHAEAQSAENCRILYHNHDQELTKIQVNGEEMFALDHFMRRTSDNIMLQMDIGWAFRIQKPS